MNESELIDFIDHKHRIISMLKNEVKGIKKEIKKEKNGSESVKVNFRNKRKAAKSRVQTEPMLPTTCEIPRKIEKA